ncbi:MAG TPA: trypsin-like peptidase domain-containing protein [Isosphaeraceae bacterium]|jgi:S1-C subfamily serine protease|nr:trypsin-like peptidase domain-containing protein [Isosphaeraceae bacterium]
MKSFSTHVVTALVTLAVILLLFGNRFLPRHPAPVAQIPLRGRADNGLAAAPVAERERPAAPYNLPTVAAPPLPEDLLTKADADEQINIRVYAAVNRSVVNITSSAEVPGMLGEEEAGGSGSGFVIDRQGLILTNYHVIEGAEVLQVTLYDGSTHSAEVVGKDPSNDVAVIRITAPAEKLTPVALGESSRLLVGQKVLALGNPFGLERTLTTGIISSLERSMRARNGRTIKGIIQTDAAINPGNSGGPLLNSRGEVIGMTTAIVSHVGQSAGIGFAVPINNITRILKPLVEHGRVTRADLGVRRVLSTDAGLLVIEVVEGGPADRAGIRPMSVKIERVGPFIMRRPDPDSADIVVAIDGKRVASYDELLTEVESHAPGQTVTVTVLRVGRRKDIPVSLGKS